MQMITIQLKHINTQTGKYTHLLFHTFTHKRVHERKEKHSPIQQQQWSKANRMISNCFRLRKVFFKKLRKSFPFFWYIIYFISLSISHFNQSKMKRSVFEKGFFFSFNIEYSHKKQKKYGDKIHSTCRRTNTFAVRFV